MEKEDNGAGGQGDARSPAEMEKLRMENEALRAQLAEGGTGKKHHFWRSFLVWFLIVLASILSLAGALSVWVKTTTLDTNTFVGTVAPLVRNDAVAKAVSDAAVTRLFQTYDVSGQIKAGLNELTAAIQQAAPNNARIADLNLSFIAGPISSGLESVGKTAAQKVLQSAQFYAVWQKALTEAHTVMVNIITGKQNAVVTSKGDAIVLNLGELLSRVQAQLVDAGLTFLNKVQVPANFGQIELFKTAKLDSIKSYVKLLNTLSWVLPLLAFIFFVVAVLIAPDRRRALMGAGIGLGIAMLMTLIVLRVAHNQLLGQIKKQEFLAAADVVWGTLLSGLVQALRGFLALGIVVAVGAAVAGPYKWAVWTRGNVTGVFKDRRERREGVKGKGPVATFVDRYAWWLRGAGFVIALIVLVALPNISGLAVIIAVIVLAVYLAVVELLR